MPYTAIITPRVTQILDRTAETIGQRIPNIVRNDLARSPERDCFVSTPQSLAPNIRKPIQLNIKRAVSDYDISAIHQIDLEAFAQSDPVPSDLFRYKSSISHLKSYIVKNNSGEVTGYYQTEPVKNGLLYIYSIGIPKNLRGTKTSFHTLMQIKKSIQERAIAENVKTISLHVDSANESLVKMYKKFGFEIKHTEPDYYANRHPAFYMEQKVDNKQSQDSIKAGYTEKISKKKSVFIDVSNITKNNQLEHYLLSLKNDDGESLFNRRDIRKITNAKGKPDMKADFVSKLIQIKKLSGLTIAQMTASVETKERAIARIEFISKASAFDKITSVILVKTAHLINTKEEALFKLEFMEELAKKYMLTEKETYQIINSAGNKEQAKIITNSLNDKKLEERIRNIENLTGLKLYANVLRGDDTYKYIDDKKLNELYKFMQENRSLLQAYGYQRASDAEIKSLFNEDMLKALGLIDYSTIKYAMKLKYRGFEEFISEVAGLREHVSGETYNRLRGKLSEINVPSQKFNIIQTIIFLTESSKTKPVINDLLDLIKSNKLSNEQQKLVNQIFASNKSYQEQISELFEKFEIPNDKKEKLESFLKPQSCQEQLSVVEQQIQALNKDTKIEDSRKKIYIKALEKRKNDIINNPEESGRIRPNSKKMKELFQIVENINEIENNKQISNLLKTTIYKVHNIEPTTGILNVINYDEKYMSLLTRAPYWSSSGFSYEFKKLIELIKTDSSKPLSDLRETFAHNNETKKLFEDNGINYQKWIKFDPSSYLPFSFETDTDESTKMVAENIVKELNGDLFKSVSKTQTDKILKALEDAGFEIYANTTITKNGQFVTKNDLSKVIDIFKETINQNSSFWNIPLSDTEAEKLKNELVDHLLGTHRKTVSDLQSMADTKMDLAVRLSDDDDIGRNLFLGNHVGCCTSIGNSNAFAAPQHLMNTFVRGIEIVDKKGNSYGNSMCYFANVDGKVSFIIDSFEANGKLGCAKEVTDAIIEYAKQVTREMGKVDIPIYFGPNYNKIDTDKLTRTLDHTIEVIGKVDTPTYIDAIGGHKDVNVPHSERRLFTTC